MLLTVMDLVKGLDGWFADRLQGLRCTPETLAYVVSVMSRRRWEADDLSKRSVVLAFRDATIINDFASFQRIGDWVLWTTAVWPEFAAGHQQAVEAVGRQSYLSCHKILRGQWHVYEELADDLPSLAARVRRALVQHAVRLG